MSALDNLRTIAGGERAPDDGMLGNARCAWGRGELIGEEGVLAAFCSKPFPTDAQAIAVETSQGAALIRDDDALIADVYDGRMGRLWRVGNRIELPSEQAVDVAFDADMRHERGDVCFRAEDHPELPAHLAEAILNAAKGHLQSLRRAGGLRARAFVVRAFGAGDRAAALLSFYTLSNEASRSASFSYAIVGVRGEGEPIVVSDGSARREWTPRL